MESEEHARARAAKICGRILGYAYGNESSGAIVFSMAGNGLKRCLERLMKSVKISPGEIDSLELHGTATKAGDLYETAQIKQAFGKDAYQISMSAIKSLIGHTIGASGALSFIASLISLRDQFVPPTANLNEPDPACDLDYTPCHAKRKKVKIAGSLSMGFGGQIGAILVGE